MKTWTCTVKTLRGTYSRAPFGKDICGHERVVVVSPTGKSVSFQLRFLRSQDGALSGRVESLLGPLTLNTPKKNEDVSVQMEMTAAEMKACLEAEYWHEDRMADYAS